MSKKVLVVLANGFEEIEAVTSIDVLRRAGLEVIVAGLGGLDVKGAHDISVRADIVLNKYKEIPDAIVLPGGMPGAENLSKSGELKTLLQKMNQENKLIAAICATPGVLLANIGFLDGKKATCFPGFEKNFGAKTTFLEDRVVSDGNVITSRSAGTALEFALRIVEKLSGKEVFAKLKKSLIV